MSTVMEQALTIANYRQLGDVVSYTSKAGDTASIYAIVDTASDFFGANSTAVEDVTTARVLISDVATPRRGDLLVVDGTAYLVDGWRRQDGSRVEWSLTLTERDR